MTTRSQKLNKEQLLGASRELAVALGAFLFAFFPGIEGIWNEALGVAVAAVALGFSVKAKELTQDVIISFIRKLVTFAAIVIGSKLSIEVQGAILTAAGFIVPVVWQWIEKAKNK